MDGYNVTQFESSDDFAGRSVTRRRAVRLMRKLFSPFFAIVVVPSAIVAGYTGLIATPEYVSESQFIIRGPSGPSPGVLASLLTAGGSNSATEDTYAVQDYLTSRDALAALVSHDGLRAAFAPKGTDLLSRFPNFITGHTFEDLYRYYRRHVSAQLDSLTGVSSIKVITFSPTTSQRLAQALLVDAEALINQMNDRQRQNLISSSERELEDAERRLKANDVQLAAYRNRVALLDPLRQSEPVLHSITDLQAMLTSTKLQMIQLQESAPNSPLLPVYRRRAAALVAEIGRVGGTVTGADTSLVPKITQYDDLEIQRDLVEKEVALSAAAVENAKTQADKQLLYLEEIVQPNRPDYAEYPRPLRDTAVAFASLLAMFLIGRLLLAGVKEHKMT